MAVDVEDLDGVGLAVERGLPKGLNALSRGFTNGFLESPNAEKLGSLLGGGGRQDGGLFEGGKIALDNILALVDRPLMFDIDAKLAVPGDRTQPQLVGVGNVKDQVGLGWVGQSGFASGGILKLDRRWSGA